MTVFSNFPIIATHFPYICFATRLLGICPPSEVELSQFGRTMLDDTEYWVGGKSKYTLTTYVAFTMMYQI
jgi:hypothetical protein